MDTTDLIKILAERFDETQTDIDGYLQTSTKIIRQILDKDIQISIPGLGTFYTHTRDERKSYDPYHEHYLLLPPKRVIEFNPSSTLKDEVKDKRV